MSQQNWWNTQRYNSGRGNATSGSSGTGNSAGFGTGGASGTTSFAFSPYLLNDYNGMSVVGTAGASGNPGSTGNTGASGNTTAAGAGGAGNPGTAGNPGNAGASGSAGTGATSGGAGGSAPTVWTGKDASLGVLGAPGDSGEIRTYNSVAVNRRGIYPVSIGTGTNSGSITVSWNRTIK
jgi:pilus assembly protein FimV